MPNYIFVGYSENIIDFSLPSRYFLVFHIDKLKLCSMSSQNFKAAHKDLKKSTTNQIKYNFKKFIEFQGNSLQVIAFLRIDLQIFITPQRISKNSENSQLNLR